MNASTTTIIKQKEDCVHDYSSWLLLPHSTFCIVTSREFLISSRKFEFIIVHMERKILKNEYFSK